MDMWINFKMGGLDGWMKRLTDELLDEWWMYLFNDWFIG